MDKDRQNYYKSKKSELFVQFDGFNNRINDLIAEKYGEENRVKDEIKQEYENLYEEMPYIGGDNNSLTTDLVSAVQCLAVYNILKRHKKPLKEIGELCYRAVDEYLSNNPELVPPMTDPNVIGFIKYAANESELRKFSGDWVYNFIDSDEENDYGLDFVECGIYKFFKEHDAEEFTPYMCAMDRIMSKTGNLGLHRTETIAEGSNRCNFRFKSGRKTMIVNTVIEDDE